MVAKCQSRVKVRPIGSGVVVRRNDSEIKTEGGIVLPDVAKEKPCRGVVVAVGPGNILNDGTRAPMEVKVGDEVIFGQYSGHEIEVSDTRYIVMTEKEVHAIVLDD